MPSPAGPTVPVHYRHFWFDWQDKSFWPFDLQEDHEPFVLLVSRDVRTDPNVVYYGSRDGYVRRFRRQHETDEGYEIVSYVAYGPIRLGGDQFRDGMLVDFSATVGEESGRVTWWLYLGDNDEAAVKASVSVTGTLAPGRNYTVRPRRKAGSLMLMIGNGEADRAWQIEGIVARIKPLARQRLA